MGPAQMIFDLDRRKLQVVAEHLIVAAAVGAYAAISSVWTVDLDFFDHSVRIKLIKLAVNGAVQGLFLYRLIPSRSPRAMERRSDPASVVHQAKKLGLLEGDKETV